MFLEALTCLNNCSIIYKTEITYIEPMLTGEKKSSCSNLSLFQNITASQNSINPICQFCRVPRDFEHVIPGRDSIASSRDYDEKHNLDRVPSAKTEIGTSFADKERSLTKASVAKALRKGQPVLGYSTVGLCVHRLVVGCL